LSEIKTIPKNFVFVLMPFTSDFNDIYQLGIKEACKECNTYCERVDEQIFDGSILERIYNQISKADIIVADMTGRNANVFYETGYAHALGKRTILLTKDVNDIPFDLRHYAHIIYGDSIIKLKAALIDRVNWALSQPQTNLDNPIDNLQFYLVGEQITDGAILQILLTEENINTLDISIHNAGYSIIDAGQFLLGFKSPATLRTIHSAIPLPENMSIKYFDLKSFWPDSWQSVYIEAYESKAGDSYNCSLVITTAGMKKEIQFKIVFIEPGTIISP
jgi:hypothetical protein